MKSNMKYVLTLTIAVLALLPLYSHATEWMGLPPSRNSINGTLYTMLETINNSTTEAQKRTQAEQLYRYCNTHPKLNGVDYAKAEALSIMCIKNISNINLDTIKKHKEECQKLAKKTGIGKHYFLAWYGLIEKYISLELFSFAINECQDMLKEATSSNFEEGMAYSYHAYGKILHIQRAEAKSNKYFMQAISLYEKVYKKITKTDIILNENIFACYDRVCSNEIKLQEYHEAKKHCLMSAKYAKNDRDEFMLMIRLASVYALTNEVEKAWQYMRKSRQFLNRYPDMTGRYYLAMAYCHYDVADYKKALVYCDSCDAAKTASTSCRAKVYEAMGDYRKANEANKQLINQNYSTQYDINNFNYDEFSILINKDKDVIKEFSSKLEKQKNITTLLLIGLIVLVFIIFIMGIIVYGLSKRLRLVSVHNAKLTQKKQMVQQSYHEIEKENITLRKESIKDRELLNSLYQMLYEPLSMLQKKVLKIRVSDTNQDNNTALSNETNEIINEVLATMLVFSEIRSYQCQLVSLEKMETDISSIFHQVEDIIITRHQHNSNNKFHVDCSYSTPLTIHIDSVIRILDILLENANKFTKNGEIYIAAKQKEDCIEISVTDTGCGIEKNKAERIFDLFYKCNKHTSGYGMGLYLARIIAYNISSQISYDTSYENGTRMILKIPVSSNKKE